MRWCIRLAVATALACLSSSVSAFMGVEEQSIGVVDYALPPFLEPSCQVYLESQSGVKFLVGRLRSAGTRPTAQFQHFDWQWIQSDVVEFVIDNHPPWRAIARPRWIDVRLSLNSTAFLQALAGGNKLEIYRNGLKLAEMEISSISDELETAIECLQPYLPDLESENAADLQSRVVGDLSHRPIERNNTDNQDIFNWIVASDLTPQQRIAFANVESFRLNVDEEGRPIECSVEMDLDQWSLVDTICSTLLERTNFYPAQDRRGNNISSVYVSWDEYISFLSNRFVISALPN